MAKNGEIFDSEKSKDSKYKRSPHRVLIKTANSKDTAKPNGRITEVRGKNYFVSDLSDNRTNIECTPAGTIKSLHKNASLLATGDYVGYVPDNDNEANLGKITAVFERKTWLSRKPLIGTREDLIATNAEVLLIIMSTDYPAYNKRLIDRLIVAAKIGNLLPAICINKIDLFNDEIIYEDLSVYSSLNYPIFFVSAETGNGLTELRKHIKQKEVIFAGPSGVGKSSIINKLFGKTIQKISSVSVKTTKGKHTTSNSRILELDKDTKIIDTPGFREFGIVNINKTELSLYFDEFNDYYEHCRFMPCSHTHEPDCAVKNAVIEGKIDSERYESYVNIYRSLE